MGSVLAAAGTGRHYTLAEIAKCVPIAVVCLVSALAFHCLTDHLPRHVWLTTGSKDWAPKSYGTPIRIVRFTDSLLHDDVETHVLEGVPVKVFRIAKTTADRFRNCSKIGLSVAIESFRKRCGSARPRPVKLPTRLNVVVAAP